MREACVWFAPLAFVACVGDAPTGGDGGLKQGDENGQCFDNGTCNAGLVCVLPNKCVKAVDGGADAAPADASPPADAGDDSGPDPCLFSKLFSWWKADGTSADEQGHAPLVASAASYTTRSGNDQAFVLNGANYLDATGPFKTFGPPGLGGLPPVTIEAWVKFDSVASGVILGTGSAGFILEVSNGYLSWTDNNQAPKLDSYTLSVGNWYHIAVTATLGVLAFYVNGQPTGSSSTFSWNASGYPLRVGALAGNTPSRYLQGSIADLAVYMKILSAQEISDLYSGAIPKCR